MLFEEYIKCSNFTDFLIFFSLSLSFSREFRMKARLLNGITVISLLTLNAVICCGFATECCAAKNKLQILSKSVQIDENTQQL